MIFYSVAMKRKILLLGFNFTSGRLPGPETGRVLKLVLVFTGNNFVKNLKPCLLGLLPLLQLPFRLGLREGGRPVVATCLLTPYKIFFTSSHCGGKFQLNAEISDLTQTLYILVEKYNCWCFGKGVHPWWPTLMVNTDVIA